jgi:methylmalonyl-CoA carboxyltransferase large subunit
MATRKAVSKDDPVAVAESPASANGSSEMLSVIAALRAEIAALAAKVASLESGRAVVETAGPAPAALEVVAPAAAAGVAAVPEPAAQEEGISEDIMLAISAAVAAFLGKRAPIRQIRLLSSGAWAQQGRAFIQASHRIEVHHGAHHHHH